MALGKRQSAGWRQRCIQNRERFSSWAVMQMPRSGQSASTLQATVQSGTERLLTSLVKVMHRGVSGEHTALA